jgi:hypothetical protein
MSSSRDALLQWYCGWEKHWVSKVAMFCYPRHRACTGCLTASAIALRGGMCCRQADAAEPPFNREWGMNKWRTVRVYA